MQLSLEWELSFWSCSAGPVRRMWTVNSRQAARQHFRPGQLPLGDDDDRRGADGQARILVGRALDAARHHQADVHAVAHGVGLDDVEQARRERLAGQADVDAQHLGAVPQAVEVLVEEGDAPAVEPEALPDAVAEHEAGIEHGNLGLGTAARARR